MKHLDVPIPQTLSASYLIRLAAPMTGAEVHRRITRAVGTRLTGPLKTPVLQWTDQGAVPVQVLTRPDAEPLPGDPDYAIAEQRSRFKDARAFVRVSVTHPASLIAVHEWKARGPAAAFAADVEAPLIDTNAHVVLDARDALASLPDTTFAARPATT